MKILDREILLVIFDLDGTLLDSTSLWAKIDQIFFARHNQEVPPHYGATISTMGLKKAATYTKEHYFPELDEQAILDEWDFLSKKEYEEEIPLKEGAIELLECFKQHNIPLAIATANSPHLYKPALKRLGIENYFQYATDPSCSASNKSTSRMFDELAAHFGYAPKNVMVIEDSMVPLQVCKAAGYLTIGVYDKSTTKDILLAKSNSDLFLNNLGELIPLIKAE